MALDTDNETEVTTSLLTQDYLTTVDTSGRYVNPNRDSALQSIKDGYAFDFTKNPKQVEFIKTFVASMRYQNDLQYLFYGGAIRGGKTSVCLYCFHMYMLLNPGARGHIIRKSMASVSETTIVSFKQMVSKRSIASWKNNKGHITAYYHNGSEAHFISESTNSDKDLNKFKGLETNIIFPEQAEELQKATYYKCIERVGTYQIRGRLQQPRPIMLLTFNPTYGWLKELVHEPYLRNELKPPYYYLQALPIDNPFLSPEMFAQWATMDDISYKRFVLGDWDARDITGNFAYEFDPMKHLSDTIEIDFRMPLRLSFDFNVSPMTAILYQVTPDGRRFHVHREFRKENCGIETFCKYMLEKLPDARYIVTGDPAGRARNALAKDNLNFYIAIKDALGLRDASQIEVLSHHPTHENSYVLTNRVLHMVPDFKIHTSCKYLIEDLQNVKVNAEAQILKDKRLRPGEPTIGHLLDTLRYAITLAYGHRPELKFK